MITDTRKDLDNWLANTLVKLDKRFGIITFNELTNNADRVAAIKEKLLFTYWSYSGVDKPDDPGLMDSVTVRQSWQSPKLGDLHDVTIIEADLLVKLASGDLENLVKNSKLVVVLSNSEDNQEVFQRLGKPIEARRFGERYVGVFAK